MRWKGYVACVGEVGKAYRILIGKSERKKTNGRSRTRWDDNIKMDV
jgi:hypothetical protein